MSDRLPGSSISNPIRHNAGHCEWLIYLRDDPDRGEGTIFEFCASDISDDPEDWRWGRAETVSDCKQQINHLLAERSV